MSLESKLQEVNDTKAAVKKTVAYDRLAKLFDEGSMVEFDSLVKSEGGLAEVVTAYGTVDGLPAYAFAQNGDVTGGSVINTVEKGNENKFHITNRRDSTGNNPPPEQGND